MRAVSITIKYSEHMHPKAVAARIRTAVRHMRAQRAGAVLFSENFPYRDLVLREGFKEADARYMMEVLAAAIAGRVSERRKSAALFTERLTSNAFRTLNELCGSFRTVLLFTDSDRDACRALSRLLGISIVLNPTAGQLKEADAAVFFSAPHGRAALSEKTVAIPTGPAAMRGVSCHTFVKSIRIELAGGLAGVIPAGFSAAPLVSAALECQALGREAVKLGSIRLSNCTATRTDTE